MSENLRVDHINVEIKRSDRFGFHTNALCVMESLRPGDTKTGTMLAKLIDGLFAESSTRVDVGLATIESAEHFEREIEWLTGQAGRGMRPVLHIECHGDNVTGLQFSDRSVLPWPRLAVLLRNLNLASDFNLVLSLAACYGASFLRQMAANEGCAPCVALIAPSLEVEEYEVMAGYRTFFRSLYLSTHANTAFAELEALKLEQGEWIAEMADEWLVRVVGGYLARECTIARMNERAERVVAQAELEERKVAISVAQMVEQMTRGVSAHVDQLWRTYFAIDQLPHNQERFAGIRDAGVQIIRELRKRGTHAV